ncbi:DUF4190 domain-containing protein [Gordonia bronchialis]|uniref:DUF4190 domain-containing protein n=1 Tax=Gordonia bronchialis TaxID=2054 RepID=UPI00242D02FD|nr:DUF4190 domain-containing protein [Gordonia bronchialis]
MTNPQGPEYGRDPDDTWSPAAPAGQPYAPTELSPTYQNPSDPYGAAPGYAQTPDPYLTKDPYGSNPPLPPVAPPGSDPSYGPGYSTPYGAGYTPYPQYGAASQYPYGASPYGYPPVAQSNGHATTALVCGIVSLVSVFVLSCFSLPVSGPTGIVALVMGFKARCEIEDSVGTQTGGGNALAGLITGGIGLLLSVILTVLIIVLFAAGSV